MKGPRGVVRVGQGDQGGSSGVGEGIMGVVRSMRGDHGGLMDPGW